MIYGDEGSTTKSTKIVDVDKAERHQFVLSSEELTRLAKQAMIIENITVVRWILNGQKMAIVVKSLSYKLVLRQLNLVKTKPHGTLCHQLKGAKVLTEGRSIGQRVGSGKVRIVTNLTEMSKVQDGDVLVSDMTDLTGNL